MQWSVNDAGSRALLLALQKLADKLPGFDENQGNSSLAVSGRSLSQRLEAPFSSTLIFCIDTTVNPDAESSDALSLASALRQSVRFCIVRRSVVRVLNVFFMAGPSIIRYLVLGP